MASNNVRVVGRVGGPFNIDGEGFGTAGGQVTIGGRVVEVTRWNDKSIKGMLPADLPKEGEVVVTPSGAPDPAPVQTGVWPVAKGAQPLVTVRTKDGSLVQGELVTDLTAAGVAAAKPTEHNLIPAGPDKNPPPGSIANPAPQLEGDKKGQTPVAPAGSTAVKT